MVMLTDISHFLDENGDLADVNSETKELFDFLSSIVSEASSDYGKPMILSCITCIQKVDNKVCGGEVEIWVGANDNRIGWECLECASEGVISNWEGTAWDKRSYSLQ